MNERPTKTHGAPDRAAVVASALLLALVVALLGGLLLLVAGGRQPAPAAASASSAAAPGTFLLPDPRPAPEIALSDASGATVTLSSFRGREVLVFFGYTHCPDVCPVTIGTVGNVIATVGGDAHALFISVDPERDTPAWLAEFGRFMPPGFTALTGSPAQIRATADAWGVRYARVETGSADGYSMSHTADVFLVGADGLIRASFPFGTEPEPMAAVVRAVATTDAAPTPGTGGAGAAPSGTAPAGGPGAGSAAAGSLRPEVVSSSLWAGAPTPIILHLADAAGPLDDPAVRVTVRVVDAAGRPAGPVAAATAVQPPGVARVSHLASIAFPTPGRWTLEVTAFRGGETLRGSVAATALDAASTAALGEPAPTLATPTTAAVGGDLRLVSTDPTPDRRLYERSTAELTAAGIPYVLVVDSVRFRVTPACGKAVALAKLLAERWPSVGFVHLEPYPYRLVTEMPTLDGGDPAAPPLGPVARAWGLGPGGWGATSVPWIFVVDGRGIVRAKYQGLVGSDDVDVVLATLAGR